MINISIRHNLYRKIDEIERIHLNLKQAVDIGIQSSINEIEEELTDILGDESRWYEVVGSGLSNSLVIRPSESTLADPEKMRFVAWMINNFGDDIIDSASRILKSKVIKAYRGSDF
jgi:hypothetical protein